MSWTQPFRQVKQYDGPTPSPRPVPERIADHRARLVVPLPKQAPARSEPYRRLVAAMPCAHCGRAGPSQCAHDDAGKGMAIKADDRTCWPACADRLGAVGCHTLIGARGMFTQAQRRVLEEGYAATTRAQIKSDGNWPAGWPA